jgi:ATP phosphoribosyltransferase
MRNSELPDANILKTVLEPLLEDFEYWFERSRHFLEKERLSFMHEQEQSDLLMRIQQAQEELNTVKMLFKATQGQVGIDMATLTPWHHLVTEYWNVARRFYSEQGT